jgi:flagellar hook assembly protein FlgD
VIYDVSGRCVRTLFSRTLARGTHTFAWDGRDDAGRPKAAGIYFAVGRAGKSRIERKIVLVR